MASRVAQLPNVGLVSGITRPVGQVPPEFRATYQAGIVGDRLADGSTEIGKRAGDLNRLASGANTLADNSVTCVPRSTGWRPASKACSTRSRR